jgi:nickel superoxide dismutase
MRKDHVVTAFKRRPRTAAKDHIAVPKGWSHGIVPDDKSAHVLLEYGRGTKQASGRSLVMGLFRPQQVVYAHCDLFCGVYDPAQAKIEAMSVLKACEKYAASDDDVFRQRAVLIKEERAELVKHHLGVLWTDFFKPHHVEAFPELHDLFWKAIKAAGDAKKSTDIEVAKKLVEAIDDIAAVFWQTEESKTVGVYPPA